MLSRVANLVYWMARYLERAQNSARILDANTQLAIDMQSEIDIEDPRSWEPIIHASGHQEVFKELFDTVNEENVVNFVIFERRNPSSVLSCVNAARENARCIREQLASETWEQLNKLYLRLRNQSYADYQTTGSNEFLNRLKASIQLFYGIAASMLPRNEAWFFYEVGRHLERADNTSRVLDVKYFTILPSVSDVGSALDLIQWAALLRSCSGFEAFRKSRRGMITPEKVMDYLVLDEYFPRSIRYSIIQAEEALRRISHDSDHHYSNAPTRSLGKLRADLDYATIKEIVTLGLHEYIDMLQTRIGEIHEDIASTFFDYDVETANIIG